MPRSRAAADPVATPGRPATAPGTPSRDLNVDAGPSPAQQDILPRRELKRRATAGVIVVGTRGLAILLIGFAGNIVVARLLAPGDLGMVAIGMSFVLFTGLISDGGLGAGLIRRAESPKADELSALSALQLAVTGAVALAALAAASPFGRVGWVTAIMVASMPLVSLQFPGRILLERSLSYRRLVAVELSQVLCFHGWAIGTVLAGFGVWGLATATVVRALVGAGAMVLVCPAGLVRPRWSVRRIKPLVGFGLRFQAVNATWLLRDQVLNVCVGAVGGVASLGLWALAKRLMEVPYLMFDALWRVSFPTMSQLLAGDEEAAPLVSKAEGLAGVGSGFVLTALAGAAPGLVPGLFGEQWRGAAVIVPWACLGLAIGGTVSVATQGYLYAVGDAAAVLRAGVLQALTWLAVTMALLPSTGVVAVGIGWCVSAVVEAVVLGRATTRRIQVRLLRPLVVPIVVGLGSGAVGWTIAARGGGNLASGALAGACAALLFAVGNAAANRRLLRETWRFAASAVRAALSRRPAEDDA